MKKIILGLAIILACVWIYVIYVNYSYTSNLIIPFKNIELTVRTSWVLLGFGILTIVIDFLSALWLFMSKTDLNKNYQVKMDKLSVEADSDKSQVRILENKIKTLEAVIDKLTKEKNV